MLAVLRRNVNEFAGPISASLHPAMGVGKGGQRGTMARLVENIITARPTGRKYHLHFY